MKYLIPLIAFYLIISFKTQAQSGIVNCYAQITNINVGKTILTLANVDETGDTFEDGEKVIVMQMQDDVIGGNTTNASSFGNLGAIASAGLYEIAFISSHTETAGFVPTTITLSSALQNNYSTAANSSVQVISFRRLGTPNFTTVGNITAKDWNGITGGVVALEILGTLTLAHNITADAAGFVGGARSANYYPGGTTCDTVAATWIDASSRRGEKGESIFKRTLAGQRYGKAKILNGGGGGVNINAGGGGGGNYSAGGDGYMGWSCAAGSNSGGKGGISLSASITGQRFFMGGGGGGGQQNDGNSSAGSDGGGIVIVHAITLTVAPCAARTISANGGIPANAGNDGAGGGGAGGTVSLYIQTYSIGAGCPLTVSSNGGRGGNITDGSVHAGGGGGGQGVVIYGWTQPVTNVTTQTNNGAGGFSSSANSAATQAGSGAGSNGAGILTNALAPLPVSLIAFHATKKEASVLVNWITATETNNNFFTVERSGDALTYTELGKVNGAGNSNSEKTYILTDPHPLKGNNYYRLKQTDFDGKYTYSPIRQVYFEENPTVFGVIPNPMDHSGFFTLSFARHETELISFSITDNLGKNVFEKTIQLDADVSEYPIELSGKNNLSQGVYYFIVKGKDFLQAAKIVVIE